MAQYPRFDMPRALDPMASLMDIVRLMQTGEANERAKKDQAYQDEDRARVKADRAALDSALSPQTAQAVADRYTGAPGTWQGPVDARTPPAPLDRTQVLSQAAGHLHPIINKMFDEAEESARKAQTSLATAAKAQRDAVADVNEHLAGLAYSVKQFNDDPNVARRVFANAKEAYAGQPELLKRIAQAEAQVEQDPSTVGALTSGMIGQSPRYTAMQQQAGKKTVIDLATEAATHPDPAVRASAQQTLDLLAEHDKKKLAPRVENLSEYEAYEKTAAADLYKTSPANLTTRQKDTIRQRWETDNRKPDGNDATKAATLTQRATAERWKSDELAKVERDFAERQPNSPKVLAGETRAMSTQDLEAAKARIQDSYLQQIGSSRTTGGKPAASTAQKFTVGQHVTLKDGTDYVIKEVSPDGSKFR